MKKPNRKREGVQRRRVHLLRLERKRDEHLENLLSFRLKGCRTIPDKLRVLTRASKRCTPSAERARISELMVKAQAESIPAALTPMLDVQHDFRERNNALDIGNAGAGMARLVAAVRRLTRGGFIRAMR